MDAINCENIDHYFKQCLDDNDLADHPEPKKSINTSLQSTVVTDALSTPTSTLVNNEVSVRMKRKVETEENTYDECALCFGIYCNDGEEWIQCACERWFYEDCVEEVHVDANGQDRFCPSCTVVYS